jgi:glutathione synthase/RimK-type ligase-like ATP-grasp enzyme
MSQDMKKKPLAEGKSLIGLAILAKLAFSGVDVGPIGLELLNRLSTDPDDANALMDMSIILHIKGNAELGIAMQNQALALKQVYRLGPDIVSNSDMACTHLLALVSPGDLAENNAIEFLVEGSNIVVDLLYIGPDMSLPEKLPNFDVVMVAVSESDRNRPLLGYLEETILPEITRKHPRPLINKPDRIGRLSRNGTCELLNTEPGIVVPITARVERSLLVNIGQEKTPVSQIISDGDFPIIIRPVDSHKGIGLEKLVSPSQILTYIEQRPEHAFYVSRFIDYSSKDGKYRKYRIVFIAGQPYVCHMAISDDWMVHYMSAGMLDSEEKRVEEATFMANFDQNFALKHRQAFHNMVEKLDLEYVGIDCGETKQGELLIFEVDSSMTIHAMDSVEVFPYKKIQMNKVFNAFINLVDQTKNISSNHPSDNT